MDPEIDPEMDQQKINNETKIGSASGERRWGGKCKYCKVWLQVQVQIMSPKSKEGIQDAPSLDLLVSFVICAEAKVLATDYDCGQCLATQCLYENCGKWQL